MNRTILQKCTVTAACAQTVDASLFFFFDEQPGYEAIQYPDFIVVRV